MNESAQTGHFVPQMPPWMMRRLWVVPALHVVNSLVFLGWQFMATNQANDFFAVNFTVSAQHLKMGLWWTLITSALSHYSPLHFLLNSMVLQSFGPIIERYLGVRRFLVLYFGAAVVSSLSHCLTSVLIMGSSQIQALGASGSLCGLMLVFAMLFPKSKILFMGIIPVPALIGVLIFVGVDLSGLFVQSLGRGFPIGHGAHLGGTLAGLIFYLLYLKPRKITPYS